MFRRTVAFPIAAAVAAGVFAAPAAASTTTAAARPACFARGARCLVRTARPGSPGLTDTAARPGNEWNDGAPPGDIHIWSE